MSAKHRIRMSESVSNIATALHNIQGNLKPIEKKGRNETQGYAYAKFEDYVESIKEILITEGLTIITTVREPKRLEPRQTKYGSFQYVVEVAIILRLFHKTGEWIEIDCYGEGQDSGDKAIYKAITGARKYGLACLLGLATKDDPENDESDAADQKSKNKTTYTPQANKTTQRTNAPADNKQSPALTMNPLSTESLIELEKVFSLAVDLIQSSENPNDLRTAFSKAYTNIRKITGNAHAKLDEITKHYNHRKIQIEMKAKGAS